MSKIGDILKVLDLTEEKQQRRKLADLGYKDILYTCASLADLAFRMRDEVSMPPRNNIFESTPLSKAYWRAWELIAEHYNFEFRENQTDLYCWIVYCAKPIYWICAALIAKELAREQD